MDKNKENVPKIRFSGFEDPWEQRKFSDNIVGIQTGTNLLGSLSNSGVPLLKMGNIQRGYFSLDKLELLDINEKVEEENIAYYGDFFFNTRNTLELVGKGATWTGKGGKYAFNSNIARFTFKGIDTIFFNYLYNTQDMIKQVHARAMGTTSVAAIYPRNLNSLEYKLPSIQEQKAIGTFFIQLDNLITLHQRKLENLQDKKKGLLQKMFPKDGEKFPELRFPGFTDPWEQHKLKDVSTYSNGGSFENDVQEKGRYELVTLKSVDMEGNLVHSGRYVDTEVPTLTKGTLVMVLSEQSPGLLGMTAQIPIDNTYILNQRVAEIRPNQSVDSYFLSMAINRNQQYFSRCGAGTKVQNISKSNVENYEFLCPLLQEQQKIGKFFTTLNNIITFHHRKLEHLQQQKKGLLQQMFI